MFLAEYVVCSPVNQLCATVVKVGYIGTMYVVCSVVVGVLMLWPWVLGFAHSGGMRTGAAELVGRLSRETIVY